MTFRCIMFDKLKVFFLGKSMKENIKSGGKVTVQVRRYNPINDSYGDWQVICKDKSNLLTDAGRDLFIAQDYTNTSAGTRGAGYIALSENATAPTDADTTIASEITTNGLGRADATTKTHTTGTSTAVIEHTFTASGTFTAVQKAGLFNASSGATLCHANTFTSTALSSGDQLKITWNLTLND